MCSKEGGSGLGMYSAPNWRLIIYGLIALVTQKCECSEVNDLRPSLQGLLGHSQLEAFYYKQYGDLRNADTAVLGRIGDPTTSHSCNSIRDVPNKLRHRSQFLPRGIGYHYTKYTEAYGIPVLGSSKVPDHALQRACYVLRFMLADNHDIRFGYYKLYGRVSLLALEEVTRDIPEYQHLPEVFDMVRGLGAIELAPVSSAGVENVLCYTNDTMKKEDILLRELAHGVHMLGAKVFLKGFENELEGAYLEAMASEKWKGTSAALTKESYLAEGIQTYFSSNAYSNPADGFHNDIDSRVKLRSYDPRLSNLIQRLFPCGNHYKRRCWSSRVRENYQIFRMDCK